jgi:hypothetical protein
MCNCFFCLSNVFVCAVGTCFLKLFKSILALNYFKTMNLVFICALFFFAYQTLFHNIYLSGRIIFFKNFEGSFNLKLVFCIVR